MSATAEPAPSTYDLVPYEGGAFPQSHPQRLRALGQLFGLRAADVTRCRVLELGCAFGGNLVPMAARLPGSEFVGIDLSRREIEGGRAAIQDLGLRNIRLEHAGILDVNSGWGAFDYVICHGVFSWVSEEVRDGILRVSSENLAPNGIAYVSYNTYPGWHMRETIRHMMLYHANRFADTRQRIEQARALLDFLAESVPVEDNCYGMLLRRELDLVRRCEDWYLFHDHLENVNAPLYFHEFVRRAEGHKLRYLAEADFGAMLAAAFPPRVKDTLKRISHDLIHDEQYLDFLRNRTFRQTLLCHQDVALDRTIGPEDLAGLLVASQAEADRKPPDSPPEAEVVFRSPQGGTIRCGNPLTREALAVLRESWPRAMGLDAVERAARARLERAGTPAPGGPEEAEILRKDLLQCYTVNIVELRSWQPDFVTTVSPAPAAVPLARYQAPRGRFVTSLLHESVALDVLSRQLVPVLDGTRGHEALVDHLCDCVRRQLLEVKRDGKPIDDEAERRDAMAAMLDAALKRLAAEALLVA